MSRTFSSRLIKVSISALAFTSAKCLDLHFCLSVRNCVVSFLDHHLYHSVAKSVDQRLGLLLSELVSKCLERLLFLPVSQFVDQRVCLTLWPMCYQIPLPTCLLACHAVSRLALLLYFSANVLPSVTYYTCVAMSRSPVS